MDVAAVRPTALLGLLAIAAPASAAAQTVEQAQDQQLRLLRRQVADQIQLSAYDLLDELVYGWTQDPVFDEPTEVVLAGVSVPVGLGTTLQGLIENHLSGVLLKNPASNLVLTHCPACTSVLVHSGPEGTIIGRGVDNPEALERITRGNATRYALFVDLEAEGTWLVLRARLTKLDPSLPIVWARTLSSKAGAPAMLREPDGIKSAEEARKELEDAMNDRWPIMFPARLAVRLYSDGTQGAVNPPPFLWLQAGVELALSQARAWTANVLLGYGYVPSSFDGFMAQVRFHRLLTGTSRSFTRPNLYGFVGTSIMMMWGPNAQIFRRERITTEEVIAAYEMDNEPLQVIAGIHVGLELRIGNRLGISIFGESLPAHIDGGNLDTYVGVFHSLGSEVSVWF